MVNEQGAVYAAFIEEQLKAELARRISLDDRGAKLQQSASITVGLFVTALGLMVGSNAPLAGPGLWLFAMSVLVLVCSFLCGIATTRLVTYEVADDQTFRKMLGDEHWADTEVTSRNITAYLNAKTVTAMRPGNNFKAAWLSYGIITQSVGVLLGAAAFVLVSTTTLAGGIPDTQAVTAASASASPSPTP